MKKSLLISILALNLGCQNYAFDVAQTSEKFSQQVMYNNKVDIIWLIDTSRSMLVHQEALSQQTSSLVTELNRLQMDYRMVVLSTDMSGSGPGGKFIGSPKVLTAKTPNLGSQLSSRIFMGETSSPLERGLESVRAAMDPFYLANDGKDFFRSDAMLVVNVLSNEDDDGGFTTDYWLSFFDQLKPRWRDGTRSWMLSYIGVLGATADCRTFGNYAEPGIQFMELADASGGVKESICTTNLAKAVSNIKTRVLLILTEFKLKNIPDLSTLKVMINGRDVPNDSLNGYTYNEAKNSIQFHGTWVPEAYAKISVDFKPALLN